VSSTRGIIAVAKAQTYRIGKLTCKGITRSRRFSFDYLVGASINVIALISGILG